jgi:hypothetical protein
MSATQETETFSVGERVRVRHETQSSFVRREGVVIYVLHGRRTEYVVRIGVADRLLFWHGELERV